MRKFNLEGPVEAQRHYCIPPLDRIQLGEILELIADRRYFVLHAPRQTGKTSTLLALQDRLNAAGAYRCLYVNVEGGQAAKEDTARAMQTILGELGTRARIVLQDGFVEQSMETLTAKYGPDSCLAECLTRWAEREARPLVLLLDEIDALVGDTLISVLRQLRARYDMRPQHFPQSVILCGVRDVRDYQIYSSREGANVQGGSAFNIKAESLRLGDFSADEVQSLLAQYSTEHGQAFAPAAVERLWELTCGQPWLVNALAYEACFRAKPSADPAQPVGVPAIEAAKEALIVRRVTHLDQLADKLREERVRRVILPMLAGSADWDYSLRDLEYVRDLGLVAAKDEVRMANPIYAEVVPRELTAVLQSGLELQVKPEWYVQADGSLDVAGLLSAFQGYFREHAESWVQRYGHAEAGPQLVLHAYLQRVVNSGGRIGREYAVGRGRTDLLIEWGRSGGSPVRPRKYVIECKVRRENVGWESLLREGRQQTAKYMDRCGAEAGHLLIFDSRPDRSWDERLFCREPQAGELPITVWGL